MMKMNIQLFASGSGGGRAGGGSRISGTTAAGRRFSTSRRRGAMRLSGTDSNLNNVARMGMSGRISQQRMVRMMNSIVRQQEREAADRPF